MMIFHCQKVNRCHALVISRIGVTVVLNQIADHFVESLGARNQNRGVAVFVSNVRISTFK